MFGPHGPIARNCLVAVLTLGTMASAMAQPGMPQRERHAADVEATATLPLLSVRPLRVDRPWDPRICIGCEAHPAATVGRARTTRLR